MNLKEFIKKRFVLFALILLLIVAIILLIDSRSKIDTIQRGVTGVMINFPTHKCADRLDTFPNGLFCFSVSDSKKTCYTLPDKTGGKRCSVEPYWEELTDDDLVVIGDQPTHRCPDGKELYCHSVSDSKKTCYTLPDNEGGKRCLTDPFWEQIGCLIVKCPPLVICPPINTTCQIIPCVQTCIGCGGGGSCKPCSEQEYTDCEDACKDVNVIAYVTNCETGETDKWWCLGLGKEEQMCTNWKDLSQKLLDELWW